MQNMTPMTEEQYAEHWSLESDKHQRFNDYTWMSQQLNEDSFILEIGCGNGTSSKHLLQRNCKLIIIEANSTLANIACENLKSLGYSGKIAKDNSDIDINLNFNIVVDSVFSESAENIAKSHHFDYIINWLFGASPYTIAKEDGVNVGKLDMQSVPAYRERSALRSFELKKNCINSNCKFHYIFRAAYDKSAIKSTALLKSSFAEEQSEALGLEVSDSIIIDIRKSESSSRQTTSLMKYVHAFPGKVLPKNTKAILVSAII